MVYNTYIIRHRTQVYLDDAQNCALKIRARARHQTKSSLIREAIDEYLSTEKKSDSSVTRMRNAISEAAGVAPYLPAGDKYVRQVREADLNREAELEQRRRR
jgi:predicted transcriptional regulator